MEYLRINTACDIINIDEKIVIYNNFQKKRMQLKATLEVIFIVDLLLKKSYTREDILLKAKNKKIVLEKISNIIDALVETEIIEVIEVPFKREHNNLYPEAEYNNRYAMEIASFKLYEDENVNRFEIFNKIQNTEVIIVGVGGIGSYLAVMLSALGVGKVKLIDGDMVEESNLPRQIFFEESSCNSEYKVDVLKKYINKYNSSIEVESITKYINSKEEGEKLITKGDYNSIIVIQTANEPMGEIQIILNNVCIKKQIPILFVNASTIGPFYIPNNSACYLCLMDFLNDSYTNFKKDIAVMKNNKPNKYPASIMGVIEGANVAMSEVYLFLVGRQPNSLNAIINIKSSSEDLLPKFEKIEINNKKGCMCNEYK